MEIQVILDPVDFPDTSQLEGVFVNLSDDGKRALKLSNATDIPAGYISNPQDRINLGPGAEATATLVFWGAPYVYSLNTGATPTGITANKRLALNADGTVKLSAGTAGEVIVGKSLDTVVSESTGQRVRAVFLYASQAPVTTP